MGVIIYSVNLNTSPKMSYGVFECDIVVIELHVHDFVIKASVMKEGRHLCWALCNSDDTDNEAGGCARLKMPPHQNLM